MVMKRLFLNSNVKLLAIMVVLVIGLFSPFIFLGRPFVLVNDQIYQFNLYYREWTQLLKGFVASGELPFYSWYKFLGSDFYSSSAIYTVGDIFYPLLYLVFNNVENALFAESILMVIISAFTMKLHLDQRRSIDKTIIILFSVLYSISGLATLYLGNYMFHRFYAFMPLLFTGVDQWIKNKRYLLFCFSTFFLLIQNYYLMFPVTAFLPVYFTFSYLDFNKRFVLKDFFVMAGKLILSYILGLMMGAVLLIPSFMNLIGNQRIGAEVESLFWEPRVWVGYVFSYISGPFPTYSDTPNLFQSGYNGHAYWYSMNVSPIIVFTLLGGLRSRFKEVRLKSIFYWVSSTLVLFILPISSIFHGFSEPSLRVSLPFVFLSIVLAADILQKEKFESLGQGFKIYSAISSIALIAVLLLGLYESKHQVHAVFLAVSFILSFSVVVLTRKSQNKICIPLMLVSLIFFNTLFTILELSKNYYKYRPNFTQEYVDYFQSVDEDLLYRIYIDPVNLAPFSTLNLNQSLDNHFMTTTTYDTMYETELTDFLKWNGLNWHIIDIKDPIVQTMLGVKYYGVLNDTELPSSNFPYVYNLNHFSMHKNLDYIGMGFTYDRFAELSSIKTHPDWMNELVIEDQDFERVVNIGSSERAIMNVTMKSTNALLGNINVKDETILFVSVPFNKGWRAKVNGVDTDILKVQGGFIGLHLYEGYHDLEFYFTPIGFKAGFIISSIGFMLFIALTLMQFKRTQS